MATYLILAIAAMIGYGITNVIYKVASNKIDPISLTLFTSIALTVVVFIFWLFTKQKYITPKGAEYAIIAGVIAGFAFIAYITSIHLGKVSIVSSLRGLSFLITTVIAVLFLAEKITAMKILGIIFAAIAVILLTL